MLYHTALNLPFDQHACIIMCVWCHHSSGVAVVVMATGIQGRFLSISSSSLYPIQLSSRLPVLNMLNYSIVDAGA